MVRCGALAAARLVDPRFWVEPFSNLVLTPSGVRTIITLYYSPVQLINGVPIETDCHMPELAENAPVQESARKNKRRILIFCAVSLV